MTVFDGGWQRELPHYERWFAWYPVYAVDHLGAAERVWLTFVYRRGLMFGKRLKFFYITEAAHTRLQLGG